MKILGGFTVDRVAGRVEYWTCGHTDYVAKDAPLPPVQCPKCEKMTEDELVKHFATRSVSVENARKDDF